MTEEQREMSERCVRGLGYQGNNLLCSNWNIENLNELDYNGMFEYLYGMKYGEKFNSEDYPNGIPKEEFESLIMEYLPITAEQIRDYAYLMRKTRPIIGCDLDALIMRLPSLGHLCRRLSKSKKMRMGRLR